MIDSFKRDLTRLEILLYEAIQNSDEFIYSTREIAHMLGCSVPSVRRATQKLIKVLQFCDMLQL